MVYGSINVMEEPTLDEMLEAHSLQVYNHSYDYDAPINEYGEAMDLVSPKGGSSVDWFRGSLATRTKQTLKWYKVRISRYHVPGSWLKPTQNLVVVVEELGGDPSKITLVKRLVTGVCADLQVHHPNAENFDIDTAMKNRKRFIRPRFICSVCQGSLSQALSLQVLELLPTNLWEFPARNVSCNQLSCHCGVNYNLFTYRTCIVNSQMHILLINTDLLISLYVFSRIVSAVRVA
ncbi:unnamed protein product [Prunus armeniaca]|uniref:Uncharacterized protein n=1 Tax=Prunus armeniaca TaxID=36596 RepID=A0A6J5TP66_PRUAR|nr:unnamed protein product [Prunus armeniaca]